MRQTRAVLAVALVCAAGCQHDPALRAADTDGAYRSYARERDRLRIVSDTLRVSLESTSASLNQDIENDMVFVYLSLPLHPIRGIEFDNPGIGVGYANTAMSFANVFEPFNGRSYSRTWTDETLGASMVEWPPVRAPRKVASSDMGVEPEYAVYADALRDEVYRTHPATGDDVMARTPTPAVTASRAQSTDD